MPETYKRIAKEILLMRGFCAVTCLLVPMLVGCPGQKDAGSGPAMQRFVSQEGGFQVQMPGSVDQKVESVSVGTNDADLHWFVANSDEGQVVYLAAYMDLPEGLLEEISVPAHLANALQRAQSPFSGVSDAMLGDVDVEGNAGKEVSFTALSGENGAVVARIRVFLVGNRQYQLMVLAGDGRPLRSTLGQEFFRSFRLLPPQL